MKILTKYANSALQIVTYVSSIQIQMLQNVFYAQENRVWASNRCGCPTGKYSPDGNSCIDCEKKCAECNETTGACTTCKV